MMNFFDLFLILSPPPPFSCPSVDGSVIYLPGIIPRNSATPNTSYLPGRHGPVMVRTERRRRKEKKKDRKRLPLHFSSHPFTDPSFGLAM